MFGDPVLEQRLADLLEFGEIALSLRSRLSRMQILDGPAMVASMRASTASVLARPPRERAKDRTWKGLIG